MLSTHPPLPLINHLEPASHAVDPLKNLLPEVSSEMTHEQRLAGQLIHLASQFHGSEYNQVKFGPRGSPLVYIPLSIHVPDHFKQLQARQASYMQGKSWWLYDRRTFMDIQRTPEHVDVRASAVQSAPLVILSTSSADICCDISAAIETPIIPTYWMNTDHQLKTSDTHPINISPIIPPELLSTISLHLSISEPASPTMFDIHPAFSLDRWTTYSPAPPLPPPSRNESMPSLSTEYTFPPQPRPPPVSQFIWNRSSIQCALQAALASDIGMGHSPAANSLSESGAPPSIPRLPPLNLPNYDILGEILATVDDSSLVEPSSTSRLGHARNYSAPPIMFKTMFSDALNSKKRAQIGTMGGGQPTKTIDFYSKSRHQGNENWNLSVITEEIPSTTSNRLPSIDTAAPVISSSAFPPSPPVLVRLNGPMPELDASSDDDELAFLGSPWPDYSHAAHELGIDILRIPIPEGLPPLSSSALDNHLTRLISTYTLNGTHVLVHCRGGVGRAGLVACCWMLRLGLCGWPSSFASDIDPDEVRRETLRLVEKVIGVVRRRRSLKAIETYEQVSFLVGYVEFMMENVAGGYIFIWVQSALDRCQSGTTISQHWFIEKPLLEALPAARNPTTSSDKPQSLLRRMMIWSISHYILCLLSVSRAYADIIPAVSVASQYSLATSTSIPYPKATLSNSDTQAYLTSNWGLSKGKIQNGASDLAFVSDPFPNNPVPTATENVTGPVLQVTYPKGSFKDNNSGGAQMYSLWNSSGSAFESMMISYEVAFDSGFDWVLGGKLPGLRGGPDPNGCSGGHQPNGTDCFSVRLMWRKNGAGEGTPDALTYSNPVCDHAGAAYNDVSVISQQNLQIRSSDVITTGGLYFSTFFWRLQLFVGRNPKHTHVLPQHANVGKFVPIQPFGQQSERRSRFTDVAISVVGTLRCQQHIACGMYMHALEPQTCL
ncbi:hypothetical protein EW146_g3035 [Bondarzewia mesenterica]|uniref:Tyrosine specific protein phosphatases domain-containing protein n=1 Tax=Bondarzewia mesenterica TaxID=1095465 RepID=A0A4S4M4S9_9AGAM|nr:hypothetical protein EW146_g3035 [Bondarzewia mesenterica]